MQASVGGSIKATADRLIGTVGECAGRRGRGVFIATRKRVVSWRHARDRARAVDIGGSAVAELSDRAADGRNRTIDASRAATRSFGFGVLSHCRNCAR
jgi:hypothetical protein